MKYFVVYCFGLWPVFFSLFIHFHRKRHDVESADLAGIIVIALVPFIRELILGALALQECKGVIFRKYK